MVINDLQLPAQLVQLIDARRWKPPRDVARLAEATGFENAAKLEFIKPKQMQRETDALIGLYASGFGEMYGLYQSKEGETADDPARLDVRRVIVIANNWDEEGLCLDYRPGLDKPRVMAGMWPDANEESHMRWRVAARDFAALVELMEL